SRESTRSIAWNGKKNDGLDLHTVRFRVDGRASRNAWSITAAANFLASSSCSIHNPPASAPTSFTSTGVPPEFRSLETIRMLLPTRSLKVMDVFLPIDVPSCFLKVRSVFVKEGLGLLVCYPTQFHRDSVSVVASGGRPVS